MSVMMALGDLKFVVAQSAYDTLSRRHSWRWASRTLHGASPALEYKGKNTGEIKLTGVIVAQSVSDIDEIKKMVAAGDRAEPQTLISGSNALGRNWGKWVITELTEEQSEFISDGTPQVITWSITMQEYGT